MTPLSFPSPVEELAYWKARCKAAEDHLRNAQAEIQRPRVDPIIYTPCTVPEGGIPL